ncbi:MAG: hypothetical protein E6726_08350 [Clostridium sp.]|nr:hypothetical protein [Clostridium sp.]MDU1978404.1 hypothetical protein [Clostridium sp.]MDU1994798.1 hypothetical protein [Clostridium sp.]MDU6048457.1 hypothetical protein [Clostridium sp.]MDU6222514.1 hypothetical protein [Clostridium sp.]MDU6272589.1 hypothetical protein [Clostridium sp.]
MAKINVKKCKIDEKHLYEIELEEIIYQILNNSIKDEIRKAS